MQDQKSSPLGLYTFGIAVLFLAGFLLLVILGAEAYRNTEESRNRNFESRAVLSYIAAAVRGNDSSGEIRVLEGQGPEGSDVLLIGDGSGYASRVYLSGGMLLEDYGPEDSALRTEGAQKIGKAGSFEASLDPDTGFLEVMTDDGNVLLHVRSRQ